MSVLIKGMEMPKSCWWHENGFYMECPFFDADHYCSQLRRWIKLDDDNSRPNDCPLIEVPTPHGRLIDADAVLSQYNGSILTAQCDYAEGLRDAAEDIKTAPTIIEAEKERDE